MQISSYIILHLPTTLPIGVGRTAIHVDKRIPNQVFTRLSSTLYSSCNLVSFYPPQFHRETFLFSSCSTLARAYTYMKKIVLRNNDYRLTLECYSVLYILDFNITNHFLWSCTYVLMSMTIIKQFA